MAGRRSAYAPEYRRQVVEPVRTGRTPGELARKFECPAQAIRNWVRQAQNAAFAEPTAGGALGARSGHARDGRVEGGGAQRRSDPQRFEHGAQADLVRRPRSDVLQADGVRAGRMSAKASTSMRWKGKDGVE